ncbi:MAG: acyltransferase [Paramuribaculum sp.]|nr:acyltransferase [Paramuribaculum sp.]
MKNQVLTAPYTDSQHYDTLQIMKFFLILGVVMIHSNVLAGITFDSNTDASRISIYLMRLLPGAICHACVPCFFILSGYLYFHNISSMTSGTYIVKTRRRIKTLLIPYILWNAIGLILLFIKHYYFHYPAYSVIDGDRISISGLLFGFWDLHQGYPYAFAFWFIRNLIIFAILSPISFLLGKSIPGFIIFILIISITDTHLYGFEYFSFGAFIALNKVQTIATHKTATIIAGITYIMLSMAETSWLRYRYESVELIKNTAAYIAIWHIARHVATGCHSRLFSTLVSSTFFIYAIHQFFCTITRNLFISIFGIKSFTGVVQSFFASWLTLIIISTIICLIIKAILPRTASILSGDR